MAGTPNRRSIVREIPNFVPEVGAVPFPGHRLLRLRGRGGFATVWETSTPSGELIALKFMSTATAGVTSREIRSLQTVRGLAHTHLLPIRQVYSLPGCIVIAMDLADASLLDLFELYLEEIGTLIEFPKLVSYLYHVAEAIDFLNAHKHRVEGRLVGLQHGDIKPNNILLLNDRALLADYGLATPMTGSMVPCARQGTVEYCPPEVFRGFLNDRSDQFSFAVMYHVLRTAKFPYPPPPGVGPSLKNYVRPEPDLNHLPEAERPVLARALSPIPQDRYRSCVEFLDTILRVNRLSCVYDHSGKASIVPANEADRLHPKSQLFRLSDTVK